MQEIIIHSKAQLASLLENRSESSLEIVTSGLFNDCYSSDNLVYPAELLLKTKGDEEMRLWSYCPDLIEFKSLLVQEKPPLHHVHYAYDLSGTIPEDKDWKCELPNCWILSAIVFRALHIDSCMWPDALRFVLKTYEDEISEIAWHRSNPFDFPRIRSMGLFEALREGFVYTDPLAGEYRLAVQIHMEDDVKAPDPTDGVVWQFANQRDDFYELLDSTVWSDLHEDGFEAVHASH